MGSSLWNIRFGMFVVESSSVHGVCVVFCCGIFALEDSLLNICCGTSVVEYLLWNLGS